MVVISAVEQITPAWQITSLDNVRLYDQILGIFVRSENRKIFSYQRKKNQTPNKQQTPLPQQKNLLEE